MKFSLINYNSLLHMIRNKPFYFFSFYISFFFNYFQKSMYQACPCFPIFPFLFSFWLLIETIDGLEINGEQAKKSFSILFSVPHSLPMTERVIFLSLSTSFYFFPFPQPNFLDKNLTILYVS